MEDVSKIGEAAVKIAGILEAMTSEERSKATVSAFAMLGEVAPSKGMSPPGSTPGSLGAKGDRPSGNVETGDPRDYFAAKQPSGKVETLAVAARFRESFMNAEESTMEELRDTVRRARLNFDDAHFENDMRDAKKRGYFTTGSKRGSYTLSFGGQEFVDALPDRAAARKCIRPTRKKSAQPDAQ